MKTTLAILFALFLGMGCASFSTATDQWIKREGWPMDEWWNGTKD